MQQEKSAYPASTNGPQVGEHLKSLLDKQREITAELLADLRRLVVRRSTVALKPEYREIQRRLNQVEKALEFYRRAEATVEILMAHFGGTQ